MKIIQPVLDALIDQGFYHSDINRGGHYFMCRAIDDALISIVSPTTGQPFIHPGEGKTLYGVLRNINVYLQQLRQKFRIPLQVNEQSSLVMLICQIAGRDPHEVHSLAMERGIPFHTIGCAIYRDWENRPKTHDDVVKLFAQCGLGL